MKRNALRVVCNPVDKHISYFFKNEFGEWRVLSSSSPLSRQYYTSTTVQDRANEIVLKINEIYNRKNKGLDIIFEGNTNDYQLFNFAIIDQLKSYNVSCRLGCTKVVVTGKKGVGKTTLIQELEKLRRVEYQIEDNEDYILYRDNSAEWYEIKGIDLGMENVKKSYDAICKLVQNSATMVIYCVESTAGRIEDAEKEFIIKLVDEFPELTATIALTQCKNIKELQGFIDEIEKLTSHIKVIPTLAREFEIAIDDEITGEEKEMVKQPFGLDSLSEYIFEER